MASENLLNNESFLLEMKSRFQENIEVVSFEAFILPIKIKNLDMKNRKASLFTNDENVLLGWNNPKSDFKMKFMGYSFDVVGAPIEPEIEFVEDLRSSIISNNDATAPNPYSSDIQSSELNPNFTFDNWVVGDANQIATQAALGVAEAPGRQYNPLLIYGDPGLGKTHLMVSIGHHIRQLQPNAVIRYITTEEFANEFISGYRSGAVNQQEVVDSLREKYRKVDVLLVDDIQQLEGKRQIQEEFFNTFNAVTSHSGQIVLTSDRLPQQIEGLEARLVTRFSQGMTISIQKPDLLTRVNILTKKSEEEGIEIDPENINLIAENVDGSVRELEGAFNSVKLLSTMGQPINSQTIQLVLQQLNISTNRSITAGEIQKIVADWYGVTIADIVSKKREQNIRLARQVATYLTRTLTDLSLPKIGQSFGGQDHSTVLHSTNKITEAIDEDLELKKTIDKLTEKIKKSR